jgi:outer membrane protein OmpA-like peptidoglycan-associated protein
MKSTKTLGYELLTALALSAGVLAGCGASAAPKELLSARDAYAAADAGPAKTLAPVQLEEARQALAEADDAFSNGEGDQQVRDLSYIAQKKSQIAGAKGKREEAERERQSIEKERVVMQEDLLGVRSKALRKTQAQLDAEKAEKERIAKEGRQALASERKARLAAEKRLSAALKSLDEIAKVKEESRGVVITLSGSVLFATGKYTLLPIAKDRLNEVAKAVKDQGYKAIIVEGHTDSRGSASANQALSLNRAQEVRTHLVSQGIESSKITAVGKGEDVPIASNDSDDGRANNRRVEIVVTPE